MSPSLSSRLFILVALGLSSMAIEEDDSVNEMIGITERSLSQGGSRIVKITPVEELVGVNKTYRCVMETGAGAAASTESIVIKYKAIESIPSQLE